MKRCVLALFIATAMAMAAQADEAPSVSITTEYLGTLRISLGKAQSFETRIIHEAKSCTLEGPNIKAACVTPSADWSVGMPDGSLRLDIRATLKTEQGDLIFLEASGVKYGAYSAIALRYTTDSEKYAWLNNIQSVGKKVDSGAQVGFDVFVVR